MLIPVPMSQSNRYLVKVSPALKLMMMLWHEKEEFCSNNNNYCYGLTTCWSGLCSAQKGAGTRKTFQNRHSPHIPQTSLSFSVHTRHANELMQVPPPFHCIITTSLRCSQMMMKCANLVKGTFCPRKSQATTTASN